MYYIIGAHKGFSSVGKLFNYLACSNIPRRLGLRPVHDSFGNQFWVLMTICFLDHDKLHKDLIIEKNGSDGRVLVKRYLERPVNPAIMFKSRAVDVICDPPIELCKVQIH